jgi:hypothetical protein
MPDKRTKRAGKSPSTQAGEFVQKKIRKIRRREHGARSPEQAIAIGLGGDEGAPCPNNAGKTSEIPPFATPHRRGRRLRNLYD